MFLSLTILFPGIKDPVRLMTDYVAVTSRMGSGKMVQPNFPGLKANCLTSLIQKNTKSLSRRKGQTKLLLTLLNIYTSFWSLNAELLFKNILS